MIYLRLTYCEGLMQYDTEYSLVAVLRTARRLATNLHRYPHHVFNYGISRFSVVGNDYDVFEWTKSNQNMSSYVPPSIKRDRVQKTHKKMCVTRLCMSTKMKIAGEGLNSIFSRTRWDNKKTWRKLWVRVGKLFNSNMPQSNLSRTPKIFSNNVSKLHTANWKFSIHLINDVHKY